MKPETSDLILGAIVMILVVILVIAIPLAFILTTLIIFTQT